MSIHLFSELKGISKRAWSTRTPKSIVFLLPSWVPALVMHPGVTVEAFSLHAVETCQTTVTGMTICVNMTSTLLAKLKFNPLTSAQEHCSSCSENGNLCWRPKDLIANAKKTGGKPGKSPLHLSNIKPRSGLQHLPRNCTKWCTSIIHNCLNHCLRVVVLQSSSG